MNKKSFICAVLLSLSSSMIWISPAQAQAFYEVIGQIESVENSLITVGDRVYKISPTAKVFLKNKEPGKISDLSRSTFIGAKLITINRNTMIDSIYVLPEPN